MPTTVNIESEDLTFVFERYKDRWWYKGFFRTSNNEPISAWLKELSRVFLLLPTEYQDALVIG